MKFSDTGQTILFLGILIGGYVLARKIYLWREKRAYRSIIQDLKQKAAFDPSSAVDLPYAKSSPLQFGLRKYLSKVLQYLVISKIVKRTESGKYYLKRKDVDTYTNP